MAGYEVTLDDFRYLLSYPPYRKSIAPVLYTWGYGVQARDRAFVVRTAGGEVIDVTDVHREIQADPERQYELYQEAQSLWR